jgi:hypothetical protein
VRHQDLQIDPENKA